jgi:hypothetical protein
VLALRGTELGVAGPGADDEPHEQHQPATKLHELISQMKHMP